MQRLASPVSSCSMDGSNEFLPEHFTETMCQDSICSLLNSNNLRISLSAGQIPAQNFETDMSFEIIKRSRWIKVLPMFIFGRLTVFGTEKYKCCGTEKQDLISFAFKTLYFLVGPHQELWFIRLKRLSWINKINNAKYALIWTKQWDWKKLH